MYREAKDALDYQIQVSDDIDDKAARIFRFDALILTVLLTGVSIAATSEAIREQTTETTVYTLLGSLTLVVFSALFALISYQTTELEVALDLDDMRTAAREELGEDVLYQEALETYAREIYVVNDGRINDVATWFQVSMIALWAGLAVLLCSAFSMIHEMAAWLLLVFAAMGLSAVGYHVDLYG